MHIAFRIYFLVLRLPIWQRNDYQGLALNMHMHADRFDYQMSEHPGMHIRAEYGADFSLSSFGFEIGHLLRGPGALQSIPLEQNPELRRFHSWEVLSICAGRTRIQFSSCYHYVGFRYHFHG